MRERFMRDDRAAFCRPLHATSTMGFNAHAADADAGQ